MIMSMQKHNNISSLWEIMSQEKSVGLVKRLLPNNSPLKVFATYKHPENICGIAFSCDSKLKLSIDSFYNLKELSVQLFLDTSYQPNRLLTIQLFSDANTDSLHICVVT